MLSNACLDVLATLYITIMFILRYVCRLTTVQDFINHPFPLPPICSHSGGHVFPIVVVMYSP